MSNSTYLHKGTGEWRRQASVHFDVDLYERLKRHCRQSGLTLSALVTTLCTAGLNKIEESQNARQ